MAAENPIPQPQLVNETQNKPDPIQLSVGSLVMVMFSERDEKGLPVHIFGDVNRSIPAKKIEDATTDLT